MPRRSRCNRFIILLFIFLLSPLSVLAAPTIDIADLANQATASARFNVLVLLSGLEPNVKYRVKALGGPPDSSLRKLYTLGENGQDWLAWNGSWSNMPEISADATGSGRLVVGNKFYDDFSGGAVYKVRIKKDGSGTNYYDSQEFALTVDLKPSPISTPTSTMAPTSTNTPTPTAASTATPMPTAVPVAHCRLAAANDGNGNELASVKVYVDGQYIHHYLPEDLKFCDGCYCDDAHRVSCSLGNHRLRAHRDGYQDWQWENNFLAGETYRQQPVLAPLASPTTLPPPPSVLVEKAASVAGDRDVAATLDIASKTAIISRGEVKGAKKELGLRRRQNPNFALPLILIGSGVAMVGGYFIMKQKEELIDKKD